MFFFFACLLWCRFHLWANGSSIARVLHVLAKPQNRNGKEVDSNWIQYSLEKLGLKLSDCLWTSALVAAFPRAPEKRRKQKKQKTLHIPVISKGR